MTDNFPITPPPELVRQWLGNYFGCVVNGELSDSEKYLATQAARWGADQELEACCEWLDDTDVDDSQEAAKELRAARRPRPQSLKGQALEELGKISISPELGITYSALETIRRALEALPD